MGYYVYDINKNKISHTDVFPDDCFVYKEDLDDCEFYTSTEIYYMLDKNLDFLEYVFIADTPPNKPIDKRYSWKKRACEIMRDFNESYWFYKYANDDFGWFI